jgi:ribosomal protein S7
MIKINKKLKKKKKFIYYKNLLYYNKIYSLFIKKIIGNFLKKGKKLYAIKLFLKLKYLIKKKIKKEPNFILLRALMSTLIKLHFIKKRFGGSKKELPISLKIERRVKFSIKSFLNYSISNRTNFIDINKLLELLIISSKRRGPIMKKNYLAYKKALDNKIFLTFRRK